MRAAVNRRPAIVRGFGAMSRRILVVEDDSDTRNYLAKGLREEGFLVEATGSGHEGLMHAVTGGFDLMVLDRMLPDLDGLSLLRSARAAGVRAPVVMLTALSAIDERVRGLRAGADDYMVKPFSFAELTARLEALMRRPAEARPEETTLVCGDLELDLIARSTRRGERRIDLLPREFQMLEYMMRRKGRVVTRTMLLEGVWDYRFDPKTNVIDVHISRLRRKIDAEGEPALIRTVRGSGYTISEPG
jgi:two-component system, OmpR family, response regulator